MGLAVPTLFLTAALPAFAGPPPKYVTASATDASDLQSIKVSDDLVVAAVSRDSYSTVSATEMARTALAVEYRAYNGPSVADMLANPPYPNFSLDQVVRVAMKYQGTPYRFGGADPSGFDCSGFTMFVYAQFGVALPHSASRQGSGGTPITPSAALPGDLVFMDGGGHNGIYLGDGMMIDSPKPGSTIQVRPIYNPDHWFVRYGI
jgi:cell wall-associated NlpC family hydrolase